MCTVFPTNKQPPTRNPPKRNRRGGCLCARPNVRAAAFPCKNHISCVGIERWLRPCRATRAGTQAPPLPISIIFFHAIPHKQNNHLRAICPNDINRPHAIHPNETVGANIYAQSSPNNINHPHAIRPYPSPPNHAVYPYPIGVILSIAQGWQVQRSLPWVMM
ncbi:hypothetical protein SAMN02745202_01090 [Segatella oulorum]|uniref:Uncharacterized protein n=1 Tax=Segatella oulorum TaxID=28136 RepID=A0A1T4NJ81_9BACT|nr:hypothetical protein SAMN02745202_01090 [Segatella oulorum]